MWRCSDVASTDIDVGVLYERATQALDGARIELVLAAELGDHPLPHAPGLAVGLDKLQVRQLSSTTGDTRRPHEYTSHTKTYASAAIQATDRSLLPLRTTTSTTRKPAQHTITERATYLSVHDGSERPTV